MLEVQKYCSLAAAAQPYWGCTAWYAMTAGQRCWQCMCPRPSSFRYPSKPGMLCLQGSAAGSVCAPGIHLGTGSEAEGVQGRQPGSPAKAPLLPAPLPQG